MFKSNKIQTLKATSGGIAELVNLQRLNLANNRIRDVDEFEHLRKLVVLRQLTFADEHFGPNPVVAHPDYRSFAITILKQVRLASPLSLADVMRWDSFELTTVLVFLCIQQLATSA